MRSFWASHPERSNAFWVWIIRTVALRQGRLPARLLLYPITLFFLIVARAQRKASRVFLSRVLHRRASWWDVAPASGQVFTVRLSFPDAGATIFECLFEGGALARGHLLLSCGEGVT